MKKFRLIFLVLLLQFCACEKFGTNPIEIDGDWKLVYEFQDALLYWDMHFADENTGWIVGKDGGIMTTTDGGESWQPQNSGTNNMLLSVHFIDTENGWTVGRDNTVLHTSNGGSDWQPVIIDTDTTQYFSTIVFTDAYTGWISSNHGKIYKSEDAGQTWHVRYALGDSVGSLMHMVNSEIGFFIPMNRRTLYQTTNGGTNWSEKPISIDTWLESDLFFLNESVGWLCNDRSLSSTANDFASVFRTTDGGSTWTRMQRFDDGNFSKMYFLDQNNGWVAGRKIYYTSDGGENWTCQLNNTETYFLDIQFVGPMAGYALEFSGVYKFQPDPL